MERRGAGAPARHCPLGRTRARFLHQIGDLEGLEHFHHLRRTHAHTQYVPYAQTLPTLPTRLNGPIDPPHFVVRELNAGIADAT